MDSIELTSREPRPPSEHYGRLRVHRDLAPAQWLVDAYPDDTLFGKVAGMCTPGFPAYARVLHPAALDDHPVRWDEVARKDPAGVRKVDGETLWHELVGADDEAPYIQEQAGLPGVWDEMAWEGVTPAPVARLLAAVLSGHTETPERCWYGLWDGYGTYDWDNRVPTFPTPHRDHILLGGALNEVSSPSEPGWQGRGTGYIELPELWWPEDHSWCVGSDTDLKSTYVGSSRACVAALLAAPGLEVHPVDPMARVG
ncbi:hypothetical protein [Streptomyces sp. NPDC051561]|uniref:hypothetical protein n=1 Tax=Streptomyces sp. NPDC051561 TaxID=3365658 RepID=UPI0037AF16FF